MRQLSILLLTFIFALPAFAQYYPGNYYGNYRGSYYHGDRGNYRRGYRDGARAERRYNSNRSNYSSGPNLNAPYCTPGLGMDAWMMIQGETIHAFETPREGTTRMAQCHRALTLLNQVGAFCDSGNLFAYEADIGRAAFSASFKDNSECETYLVREYSARLFE